MKPKAALGALLVVAGLCTGCVEQRYLITSDLPGAVVYRNGVLLGPTPVDDHFVYYGKYHFTVVADGKETLQIDQDIPAPWYEYPGLDFFSEVVYPFKIRDVRAFHYQMCDLQQPRTDDVLRRGQQLRERGAVLAAQQQQAPGTVAPVSVPGPAVVAPPPVAPPAPPPPPAVGLPPPASPVAAPRPAAPSAPGAETPWWVTPKKPAE